MVYVFRQQRGFLMEVLLFNRTLLIQGARFGVFWLEGCRQLSNCFGEGTVCSGGTANSEG